MASPAESAKSIDGWTLATISIRGRAVERDLWAREGLRYLACTDRTVLLPIVGNPRGLEGDDYFVTPDTTAHPVQVAIAYADRWAIEDPFRNTKQLLGTGDPQPWVGTGPGRVVARARWMSVSVWDWFGATPSRKSLGPGRPLSPTKRTSSFQDPVASCGREVGPRTVFDGSPNRRLSRKSSSTLLDLLAEVA